MSERDLRHESTETLLDLLRGSPSESIARDVVAELVKRFAPYVLHAIRRFCNGDDELAQEAFQIAFLRFFETWTRERFAKPVRSFAGLLIRMARNAAVDQLRQRSRLAVLTEDLESAAINLERKILVRALLDRLSPIDREILLLTVIEGFTSEEAARVLGVSGEALRQKKSRALKSLRQHLEPEERYWKELCHD